MKILIVQTSYLGDTILTTPVIAAVKKIYPDAELWMMTTPQSTQLVSRDPLLDGVIGYDKRGKDSGLKGLFGMVKHIRPMGFDLVYSLHRSLRTSILLWLAKIPVRIGFRKAGFSFLYHQTFDRAPEDHDVIRNLSILKGWGDPSDFSMELRLHAPPGPELGDAARQLLPKAPYAVLVPGSVWETKRWHADGFRKTALLLKDRGFQVVLLGGPEDVATNRIVADGLDVIDLAGKTSIPDAMYIVAHAKLVVCNDSMSLHMASAFKIPTVAIFCATSPSLGFGPWKNNARVVEKKLPCKPCGRHGGRRCPSGTEACMREVDFGEVVSAIDDVIASSGSGSSAMAMQGDGSTRLRFLFVPVSGPKGIGEYMRSLILANGIKEKWPNSEISFIINRHAHYSRTVPFTAYFIDDTPTRCTNEVKQIIDSVQPHLIVFDSGGRTTILRYTKKMGIPAVYISSRDSTRAKAFRLRRLSLISQHWIVQPLFAGGPLTWSEKLKLKLFGATPPIFLETIFPPSDQEKRLKIKKSLGIDDRPYLVFSSGGGGRYGRSAEAPDVFVAAASQIAKRTDYKCVVIMGPNYPSPAPVLPEVKILQAVAIDEFINIIHDATLLVIGGGSTIAQGVCLGKVCVAAPAADDQPLRIKRSKKMGLIEDVELDEQQIVQTVLSLLTDQHRYNTIKDNVSRSGLTNGLPLALKNIEKLVT